MYTGLDWDLDQLCPKSALCPSRMKSTKIHIWTEFPLTNKSVMYLRFTPPKHPRLRKFSIVKTIGFYWLSMFWVGSSCSPPPQLQYYHPFQHPSALTLLLPDHCNDYTSNCIYNNCHPFETKALLFIMQTRYMTFFHFN